MYGHAALPQVRAAKVQATACRPCAKAKVKCVYGDPSAPCERCARLNKDCSSQQLGERRAPLPRSRFAQLENKVDSLFKELEVKSQTHLSETSRAGQNPSQEPSPASSSGEHGRSPDMPHSLGSYANIVPSYLHMWPLQAKEDDLIQLFFLYRDRISQHFPFVVIPDVPPAQIYAERPFLFKAIIMVASYKTRRYQYQLGTQLTEEVGKRLLVDGERLLDVLQGLLIHVAWYHLHLGQVSQMTNLVQLTIGLLADLGLNKPTHGNDRRQLMFDNSKITNGLLAESRTLANDERRALLGGFYVSSIVCAIFRRVPALEFTPFMEEQLNALLDTRERDSDLLLARMVQVQQFAERVERAVPYDEPFNSQIPQTPVMLHLRTLRNEFRAQSQSYPAEIENNELLLLQKYAVEIMIHENGLYSSFWQGPATTNERIDVLWTLLQSIKAFFDMFSKISELTIYEIPYSGWGQSTYVLLIFSRLCMLECPGWDHQVAQDNIDFLSVTDGLMQKMEMSIQLGAAHWTAGKPDPVCTRIMEKIRFIKNWWLTYRPGANDDGMHPVSPGIDFSNAGAVLGDDFWEELMRDCEPLQF